MTDTVNGIIDERAATHGDPITTHVRIAQVWSAILDHEVNPVEVALCMAGLKLVRAANNPDHQDSRDDAQGYVRIADMIMDQPTHVVGVHNHPPYRPVCNERYVDGVLRGACLNDDGSPVRCSQCLRTECRGGCL